MASLLYYQVYDADLPPQPYTKQDIHYIIQLLQHAIQTGHDGLQSSVVH
ncbi:hypothetical protein [Domibacillus epiphyticus]|nr:hypothetical protein [Domibacillus epiphyticus]